MLASLNLLIEGKHAWMQVLKTLLAKVMSSNFHKRAHFDKIQDALNKVGRPVRLLSLCVRARSMHLCIHEHASGKRAQGL